MRLNRGVTLGTVVSVVVLLVLLGVALGSLATVGLSMSGSYYRGQQAEMIARAAVTQFVHEQAATSSSPLQASTPTSLLDRYRSPVFPDGGTRLPGMASITFDSSQPWFSVDNTDGDVAAAGWEDVGSDNHGVPPYSVDLIIGVTVGPTVVHYESVLQRRWPYAVATPMQLSLFGMVQAGTILQPPPSSVEGPVYVAADHLVPPRNWPFDPVTDLPKGVQIPDTAFDLLTKVAPRSQLSSVNVGIPQGIWGGPGAADVLEGRVDLGAQNGSASNVAVASAATWTGSARGGITVGSQSRWDALFQVPPAPVDAVDLTNTLTNKNELYLSKNLLLGPHQIASDTADVLSVPGSYFLVQSTLGNHRFVPAKDPPNDHTLGTPAHEDYSMAGISLENCTLEVDGDLDLDGGPGAVQGTNLPAVIGSNATLVVKGTLFLSDGQLHALDQGMVISCSSLVMSASGDYSGLILAREGALFLPSSGGGLSISGALVCGAGYLPVYASGTPDQSTPNQPLETIVNGVQLWGTTVRYDPRYLKRLNGCGDFVPILMRHLP